MDEKCFHFLQPPKDDRSQAASLHKSSTTHLMHQGTFLEWQIKAACFKCILKKRDFEGSIFLFSKLQLTGKVLKETYSYWKKKFYFHVSFPRTAVQADGNLSSVRSSAENISTHWFWLMWGMLQESCDETQSKAWNRKTFKAHEQWHSLALKTTSSLRSILLSNLSSKLGSREKKVLGIIS